MTVLSKTNATPAPKSAVSPKIIAGFLVGLASAVVGAIVVAITPDWFASLGVYGPVAYSLAVILLGNLAGYLKRDTTREAGVIALNGNPSGSVDQSIPAAGVPPTQ